jgi:hypothetical protein
MIHCGIATYPEGFEVTQNTKEVLKGDFRIVILNTSAMFPGINGRIY